MSETASPSRRRLPLSLQERELLDASDVGRWFGCSRDTICEMEKAGEMPAPVRIGLRFVRWRRRELCDWITAGCPPLATWRWDPVQWLELSDALALRQRQLEEANQNLAQIHALLQESGGLLSKVKVAIR